MKSFKTSRLLSLLLLFVFVLSTVVPGGAQAIGGKVHYVALGDSLAAGQLAKAADGTITFDKGFSGIIAEHFDQNGELASYTNKFAKSGYRTDQVLKDIVDNKEVDGIKVQDKIKAASLITVTAGANDVLQIASIDPVKETVTINSIDFLTVNNKIQANLTGILKEIQKLNPRAEVYVSGYYNPFPYLSADQQVQLKQMLTHLNGGIKKVAEENGANFVAMDGIFDGNKEQYLPNPYDIHPSLAGYQLMANTFIAAYKANVRFHFVDVPENLSGYSEIKYLVENRIMKGLSDTHFGPKEFVTRADAAMAIMNILPYDREVPANPGFADVPESHPAYWAIAQLTKKGVFMKANNFNPDSPLTRGQMAKILTLSFNLKSTGSAGFKDIKTNDPVKPYVDALYSAKITTGYPDLTFKPNQQTTRANFAQFLVRASNNLVKTTERY
ncbi:S-layer homology domain-containing protein [Pseudoneobacillus sp. C159]